MTGWRILFMGTPEFACPTLKKLLERKENVIAVYTQPDRPKGRGQKLQAPPVKELAIKNSIPVYQPARVREPEVIEQIRNLKPDLVVVVAFGQILPKSLLEIPPQGCINVHASLLPRYRGAAPLNWCIINGETETGVTTMQMDVGLDTGSMLLKKATPIDQDEDINSLHDRLSNIGAELLAETIDALRTGKLTPEPQEDSESCYAPMLKKEDGIIDWGKTAQSIHNLVRGLASWPGAVTLLDSIPVKLFRTAISAGKGIPGELLNAGKQGIEVACGEGSIIIKELQAAGGRRIDAASFIAGHPLKPGIVLTAPESGK